MLLLVAKFRIFYDLLYLKSKPETNCWGVSVSIEKGVWCESLTLLGAC